MSKVVDSMWFNTAQGSFGIILAEDETTGERKLYAGASACFDQQADEQQILSWGNKVNLGMLGSFLTRAGQKAPHNRVRERFMVLAHNWHDETDHLSSPSSISCNDTFLEILSLGEPVIPFILQDLQERGGYWYQALRILSQTDPVPSEDRGQVPKMKGAWLNWGQRLGYIEASV